MLAITPEAFDGRGPLIPDQFRGYGLAIETGNRCFA
jgi:hypothetical protein